MTPLQPCVTDIMDCPNCGSAKTRKAGFLKSGYQKYRCDNCKKQWSDSPVGRGRPKIDPEDKPVPRSIAYAIFDRARLPEFGLCQAAAVAIANYNSRQAAIADNPGKRVILRSALRRHELEWFASAGD